MSVTEWLLITLRDQVVNIIITLIVVERFLHWQERRRWRRVRMIVLLHIEAALGDNLRIWATWLAALRVAGHRVPLSQDAVTWLESSSVPSANSLPDEDFEVLVRACAGVPDPISNEPAFIDRIVPSKFDSELSSYLVQMSLDASNFAWETLVRELQVSVARLFEIIGRVPEKILSDNTVNFRVLLEQMTLLFRKLDPALYSAELWNDERRRVNRASEMTHIIIGVILMMRLVRRTPR